MTEPIRDRGRSIELRFIAVLSSTVLAVVVASFFLLYQINLDHQRIALVEGARAQARLMESVAVFDAWFQADGQKRPRALTLSQVKEAQRRFGGFGRTGEIVLGERRADEIVFLLPTRGNDWHTPAPISFDAERGGPMELALLGNSGTTVALDYSGERVLAAYEWVPFLEVGLVMKMDMAEIREPFIQAGLVVAGLALAMMAAGLVLHRRMVSPLLQDLMTYARGIRDRENRYRALVGNVPGAVFRSEGRVLTDLSEGIRDLTGYTREALVDDTEMNAMDLIYEEDRKLVEESTTDHLEPGDQLDIEYRIRRADGEIRWISEHSSVVLHEGRPVQEGLMLDVTKRKEAEKTLADLPGKLSRYLSPQIYKDIFEGSRDVKVGSSRKKLTVFFSDIVGFTAGSDSLDPEDLSLIINTYLNRMAELTIEHGGTLDKFIGDGILVFFGDPNTRGVSEDARACVRMALAMQGAIADLNQEIRREGVDYEIRVRVGISTGFCTVGNFGSENRMDYTVLGRNVNLASRLETAAPPGGILIPKETWLLVEEEFECREAEPITAKGFEKPVQVYEVLGTRDSS